MGTLGRKKKVAEVQQVEVEGKHDIDSPGFVLLFYFGRVHAESFKPSFYHKELRRKTMSFVRLLYTERVVSIKALPAVFIIYCHFTF